MKKHKFNLKYLRKIGYFFNNRKNEYIKKYLYLSVYFNIHLNFHLKNFTKWWLLSTQDIREYRL
jgi:hypothetical protein